ncbi:MAG: sigma-70 family RNA polymerase sigma factor [Ruminococcaceae bacterium]|nr:sigma-70 family RNA polymerase sigma factor [Oscillospiraceae bacterium]
MSQSTESSYCRYRKGDMAALEELILTYSDPLVRFAYCYVGSAAVAEDLMEDAMADVLIKGKHFADEAHFKAYLFKAVRHRCINYLRRHRNYIPLEDVENVLGAGNMEDDTIVAQRNRAVYACMQALPEQYRQVLTLSYFEGFSPEEVGVIMSRNKKQVYNLLARAKIALRKLLEKVGISHEDL